MFTLPCKGPNRCDAGLDRPLITDAQNAPDPDLDCQEPVFRVLEVFGLLAATAGVRGELPGPPITPMGSKPELGGRLQHFAVAAEAATNRSQYSCE